MNPRINLSAVSSGAAYGCEILIKSVGSVSRCYVGRRGKSKTAVTTPLRGSNSCKAAMAPTAAMLCYNVGLHVYATCTTLQSAIARLSAMARSATCMLSCCIVLTTDYIAVDLSITCTVFLASVDFSTVCTIVVRLYPVLKV